MPGAMEVLCKAGKIKEADQVEPLPAIMPADARGRLNEFRATILKPCGGRKSIQWGKEIFTLNKMINLLEKEYGASGYYGVCRNFRIVGHQKSLTDEAKELESGSGTTNILDWLRDLLSPLPMKAVKVIVIVAKAILGAILVAIAGKIAKLIVG